MSNTRVPYSSQKESIKSFAGTDEIFSFHQLHDVILPALLDNLVKMRNSVSASGIHEETDATTGSSDLDDRLKRILENLLDAKNALVRFKDLEVLTNKQMRALLIPNVDDILVEIEEAEKAEEDVRAAVQGRKAAEEARTVATEARISAEEARRHGDKEEAIEALKEFRRAEREVLESERAYDEQIDDVTSTVHTIPMEKIQIQIPVLSKFTTELKGNLIRSLPTTTNPDDTQTQPTKTTAENVQKEDDKEWLVKWSDLDLEDESFCESLAFKAIEERYVKLEPTLKVCLLFLVIFPDNAVIKKTAIIYWWIGEGFLVADPRSPKTVEEIANEFLEELMAKGFIEPVNKKRSPIVQRFRMNPFVRLVLLMLAKKKRLF
ncbi:uncharacterized protein LOC110817714 [Carica papaya]|uniref:uncharacterized protein LOC110817714 n=1 Tax=Carica papaya TaxID=3649 RepID=UPI000B8CC82A|nr:uncharacterized protein LOC110817714 [Carica papaya]